MSAEIEILKVLAEDGGFTAGQISRAANFSYSRDNMRARSHAVRSWLREMERNGLVRLLDDQKPTCWVRTPQGSAVLAQG